ncbi:hypothetical protein bcere0009_53330 [Bacillus cereus R309803]|nr:hypothetical protein bcere0009_53330 [Bacillus cereus R309803]
MQKAAIKKKNIWKVLMGRTTKFIFDVLKMNEKTTLGMLNYFSALQI